MNYSWIYQRFQIWMMSFQIRGRGMKTMPSVQFKWPITSRVGILEMSNLLFRLEAPNRRRRLTALEKIQRLSKATFPTMQTFLSRSWTVSQVSLLPNLKNWFRVYFGTSRRWTSNWISRLVRPWVRSDMLLSGRHTNSYGNIANTRWNLFRLHCSNFAGSTQSLAKSSIMEKHHGDDFGKRWHFICTYMTSRATIKMNGGPGFVTLI